MPVGEKRLNLAEFADEERDDGSQGDFGRSGDAITYFPEVCSMNLSPQAPQVLLVDDEVEILHETAAVLVAAGYRCHPCSTPEAAVELAQATTPDLILTDMSLGSCNGVQLCEEIRQRAELRDVPVMFLSASQIPDIIRRHNSVGSAYYLRKPIDAVVLVELIEHVLCAPHAAAD